MMHMEPTTLPEGVLILDGLPLNPLIPYQTVSQYGFLYTLVPYVPLIESRKMGHKNTQTAVPTATLGTQTRILMPSKASQTNLTLPPGSSLSFTSSEMTECPEDSVGESAVLSTAEVFLHDVGTSQLFDASLEMSHDKDRSSTPVPEQLDTTVGSSSQPDPMDATFHLSTATESSDTEDDEYEKQQQPGHSKSRSRQTVNPEERFFLVAESSLQELLCVCPFCMSDEARVDTTTRGTSVKSTTVCSCGKERTWHSQPWVKDRPLGNILLCSAILFSGVNIRKAFRMLDMMKVATLTKSQYFRTQKQHLFPAVNDVYMSKQADILDQLRPVPLVLAGDGRCDSPGHTALYGTYTLLETAVNRIIHFELVKSTEVSSSNAMEAYGLQKCLAFLEVQDMVVDSLVTDRHSGIKAMLRESCPHIKHRFDVWHVVKGIKKKLIALSRSTKHNVVKLWIESLTRHAYWCPKTSGDDGELCIAKWVSALNHIVDIHEHDDPLYPVCYHGPLSEPRQWLKEDTETYRRVRDILMAPMLLRDVPMLSSHGQTYGLEAFHSVLIHFLPKSYSFSDEGMVARTQLAILHYNENADRAQLEREGTKQYRLKPSKLKKTWVPVPLKEDATYDYTSILTGEVLSRVEKHLKEPVSVEIGPPRAATYGERPALAQAVEKHQARFQK
ncbi:uncharacterized protein LOC135391970 isoform X2 [Ornithodoros turicata]|uniref:uncharacterized protein LOC135391970 isoform X2 n=1 Tax=Ornithodoros turicata TaxID=34597 RepID=UPI003138DB1F